MRKLQIFGACCSANQMNVDTQKNTIIICKELPKSGCTNAGLQAGAMFGSRC